jgi:hypothetical protein
MRNTIKLFGTIVLMTVIGFSFITCDGGDDDGGTLTYKGKSGDYEYVLKITGNDYVLTKGGALYSSTGTVTKKEGTTYYLKPSVTAAYFTATVTSDGLIELLGSITWDSRTTEALPGQLSPSGGPGGGSGGGSDVPSPVKPGPGGPEVAE